MSGLHYLAAAFLAGAIALAALLGAFWLLGKALDRRAWIQRRLERRLARGHDRYFEELRAIEAARDRLDLAEAQAVSLQPWQRVLSAVTLLIITPSLGAMVLPWLDPALKEPSWWPSTADRWSAVLPLAGPLQANTSTVGGRVSILAGLLILCLFLLHWASASLWLLAVVVALASLVLVAAPQWVTGVPHGTLPSDPGASDANAITRGIGIVLLVIGALGVMLALPDRSGA